MFGRKKKRLEKEKRVREILRRDLDEHFERLTDGYNKALSHERAVERIFALEHLRDQIEGHRGRQERHKDRILQDNLKKGRGRTALAALGAAVPGFVAIATSSLFPEVLDFALTMSYWGIYSGYMLGGKKYSLGGKKMAAKEIAKYEEDIVDFVKAVKKLHVHITKKIENEQREHYKEILNDDDFMRFENKFPDVAEQFQRRAAKDAKKKTPAPTPKQDNKHVYEFPKRKPGAPTPKPPKAK